MLDQEVISKAMGLLGSRTSYKKAKAARLNGKLGGRPRAKRKTPPASGERG
jgi:hypothetical protein